MKLRDKSPRATLISGPFEEVIRMSDIPAWESKERKEVERLQEEYEKRFGSSFPSFELSPATDQEWIKMIRACLDSGKTAKEVYNLRDDVLY